MSVGWVREKIKERNGQNKGERPTTQGKKKKEREVTNKNNEK